MVRARGTETVEGHDGGRHAVSLAAALVVCIALSAVACNKGPARVALAEADQALVAARPELERYAPADLEKIVADTETARGRLAAGQYTDALRIAQALPERIARASARASAKRNELTPAWTALAGSLPASLLALRARVAELDASHWPHGFDAAAIEGARAELGRVEVAWGRAESAFRSGEVQVAVQVAADAQARTAALAARIASPLSRARALGPPGAPAATSRRTAPQADSAPAPETPPETSPDTPSAAAPDTPSEAPSETGPESPPETPPDASPEPPVPSGGESR